LNAPSVISPGSSGIVAATVYNVGLSHEESVELTLFINDTVVNSALTPELGVGASFVLYYEWTPMITGAYNITASALPVPEEEFLSNNVATKFSSCEPSGTSLQVSPVESIFYTNTTNIGQMFQVSIIVKNIYDPGMYGWELVLEWTPGILDCVAETVNTAIWPYYLGPWISDPINNVLGRYHQALTATRPSYPVAGTYWLANLTFQIIKAPMPGESLSSELRITPNAGMSYCLLDFDANEIPHGFVHGAYKYVSAETPSGRRDVAIVNVAASINEAYRGWNVDINVTAANLGDFTEDFDVTLYYGLSSTIIGGNSSIIGSQHVSLLKPSMTLTLSFRWNTSEVACGYNYSLTAVASVVPGEVDTVNNVLVGGSIRMKLFGDANGDGSIDSKDAIVAGASFGVFPGEPHWNPQADFNRDNYVNAKDIIFMGRNFGSHYP
jgi:hypothetical protein